MICGCGCDVIALVVVLKLEGWWGMMSVCLITLQTKSRPLGTKLELRFTDRPLGLAGLSTEALAQAGRQYHILVHSFL